MSQTVEQQLSNVNKKLNKIYELLTTQITPESALILEPEEEWLSYSEAIKVLNRSRSTLEKYYVGKDKLLVYKIDWIREGNRIKFKKDSIEKIKSDLQKSGDLLHQKLAARQP